MEPLTQTFEITESTPMRPDIIAESEVLNQFREDFLKLAPQTEGRFIKVPKMGE